MSQNISQLTSVRSLSDKQLEESFQKLILIERKVLHLVLEHVREIDCRRLYLERGFDSAVTYLVKVFAYSRSAAETRLYAARLIQSVPELSNKIKEGTINLSQLNQLSVALKQKERITKVEIALPERLRLANLIENKTCWETQKELAVALDIPFKEAEKQRIQKDDSVYISLTLRKDQYELMMNCKEIAFHLLQNNRDQSIAGFIEVMCLQYLNSNGRLTSDLDSVSTLSQKYSLRPVMSVTPKLRRIILARDQCCQFVDKKTGLICESKRALQVDHIIPKWAGGDNSQENLQALCGQHNRLRYKQQAGTQCY